MGIIITILIGVLCGWLAGLIFKGHGAGFLINAIVGIIGSFIGYFVLGLVGLGASGLLGEIIAGVLGAVILLWIISLIKK